MIDQLLALFILATTITLSLRRPHVWTFQVEHAIATGLVSVSDAATSIAFLSRPVLTIASPHDDHAHRRGCTTVHIDVAGDR